MCADVLNHCVVCVSILQQQGKATQTDLATVTERVCVYFSPLCNLSPEDIAMFSLFFGGDPTKTGISIALYIDLILMSIPLTLFYSIALHSGLFCSILVL